jgi:TolB protein
MKLLRANRKVYLMSIKTLITLVLTLTCGLGATYGQRDLGAVEVVQLSKTVPVRVSADNVQMNALATQAFRSHGRYRLQASAFAYDIRFATVGPKEVRVDVTKGQTGEHLASEVVTGTSARNALLKAADVAVEKTNGLGLKGYFASKLVFISNLTGRSEVYEGDLFFGEVHRITNDRADALMPRWSPDGTKVIYTSYMHGFPDIYVMDLSTNQRNTFESFKGLNMSARYSADGSKVAMILSGSGSPEIWVSDSRGHGLVRKTHSELTKASPCWSPDGSRIIFAQEPGPQLYVMGASGGYAQRISTGLSTYCSEPDWSRANPKKVAFTFRASGRFQIGVYDFSKGAAEQASEAAFDGVEPSWLPDGRHVVYTARNSHVSRICILDTETHRSTPVGPSSLGSTLQANVWSR